MKSVLFSLMLGLGLSTAASAQSYEAESGTLSGGSNVQSCSTCSGGNLVGYLGGPGNGATTIPVNVSNAGIYNVIIYYATADPRTIFLTPNNGAYVRMDCAPSGGWSTVASVSTNVNLNAGNNTIRLDNGQTGYGPNIDRIMLQPAVAISFGSGNTIYYNTGTGKYNVFFNNSQVITDATAVCNSNNIYNSSNGGYTSRTYSSSAINDAFGSGTRHVITLSGSGLLQMQQVFYTYSGKNYFFTEVLLNGNSSNCYRMSPLSDAQVQMSSGSDMRALNVPFDNDAWIRYNAASLGAANFTSSEVTGLYDNGGRSGLVVGSVEHMTWKTGVTVVANSASSLSNLTAFGGYTSAVTRDGRGHGWVNVGGTSCKSPRIFVDFDSDWRNAFETFGTANSLAEPRYVSSWTHGTPFGWNSWGAIQSGINLTRAKAVVDFFANSCTGFRNSDQTLYIDLDSYWDNMASGGWTGDFSQLTEFVNYCKSHGFKAGIYWAPFVDWGKNAGGTVEGTSYHYQDCWTKVNGQPVDLDGARAMDPTHPATRGRIAYLIGKFKACGFEMIKIDFLGHASLEADSYYDNTVHTGMEAFRKGMEYLTDQLGGSMLTYAAISPNLATARYVHMRRIACDAFKDIGETGYTLNSTSYGWWQKNMYNYIDADHLVFSTEPLAENRARLTSGLVTGTLITGDDYSSTGAWTGTAQSLLQNQDLLDIARNGLGKAFQPVDGNTGDQPNEMYTATIGNYRYLAIVNFGSSAKAYNVNLSRIGLNGSTYNNVKQLFTGVTSSINGSLNVTVPATDAVIYRIGL